jgi:hypothetical protein
LAAFLAVLTVGIIWLTYILPYLRAIKREQIESPLFNQSYKVTEDAPATEIYDDAAILMRESRRLRIALPYFLFAMGLCLSVDAVLDYRNILPDYLAGLSFLALCLLFLFRHEQLAWTVTLLSTGYTASTILYTVFYNRFYAHFTTSDLMRVPEADAAYLPVMITSAIAEIFFVVTVFFLLRALYAFRRANTPTSTPRTEVDERFRQEDRKGEQKQTTVLFVFAALSAILSFLSIILIRNSTAVPMQPGYGGTLYLPQMGSFWLLALVFSVLTAAYGTYRVSTRVSAIRTAIEENDPN